MVGCMINKPIGVSESKEQKGKFDLEYGFTRGGER